MARKATATFQVVASGIIKNQITTDEEDLAAAAVGEIISALELTSGTSEEQIDRVWQIKEQALADTANDDIAVDDFDSHDGGGGTGNDIIGQDCDLVDIVAILVVLAKGSAGELRFGGEGSANAWDTFISSQTAHLKVKASTNMPGILFVFNAADPAYAVAANELLRINASGGAITYNLYIFGRSA